MSEVRIRRMDADDIDLLLAMFLEAVDWRKDRPRRSLEEVLAIPDLSKYVLDWGRAGDSGLVAVADSGEPLGAAWYRLFEEADHGYGFVSPKTPELGIAAREEHRGHRLGQILMEGLIQLAADQGRPALSLSVEEDNRRAVRLYERLGFKRVERVHNAWTMLLTIDPTLSALTSRA